MFSVIEIWQKYQQNLDFKALQELVCNTIETDQDSLLLFFQELTQQLPQVSSDKERDAIMLYNILVTEDKRISDLKSYTSQIKFRELFASMGIQDEQELAVKPEEPYGLSPEVKKVIYRLSLQLFLSDKNQLLPCYENNNLRELEYLQRIPLEMRQKAFYQFEFLLPYDNAIETIFNLSKDTPERSAYIMKWLPPMFDLVKPIYKEKETWCLSSLVNGIYIIKEFFPQDSDTVLANTLPRGH